MPTLATMQTGSRVRLSPIRESDRKAFLRATRESQSLHRPWVYPPLAAREFTNLVGSGGDTHRRFLLWSRSASDSGSAALVGYFSLGEIVRGNLNGAYLGYWGVFGHTQQGFMLEGMELLLRVAFQRLKLHRLEANIQPRNVRSIALTRRVGFRKEGFSPRYLKVGGRWRDHERWAMTVEDWKARGSTVPKL